MALRQFKFQTASLATLYVVLENAITGTIVKVSDGSAQAWTSAHWALSAIACTDSQGIGLYVYTVPAGAPAGTYNERVFNSASPAVGDAEAMTAGSFQWDGSVLQVPTAAQIAAAVATTGNGAFPLTVHVVDGSSNPIGNATVRLTGTTAPFGTTNGSGDVVLSVDAGTYALTVTKGGFSYTTGSPVVVTGSATLPPAVMTATSFPSPPDPGQTTIGIKVLGPDGGPGVGLVVEFETVAGPGTAGYGYSRRSVLATAGGDGMAYGFGPKNCTAHARLENGDWTAPFDTGNGSTALAPETLGRPQD